MALFGAATLSTHTSEAGEIEKLRAELTRQKDAARLRATYGPKLTDERVDELLAEEADMAVRKVKAKEFEELNRQKEIEQDKVYRDLACELVRDGKILISVDGNRITEITPDLIILCPHCSKPLGELSAKIYEFTKSWYWSLEAPGDRNRINTFIIYSAHSPLTSFGFVGFSQQKCASCKEEVRAYLQVVPI